MKRTIVKSRKWLYDYILYFVIILPFMFPEYFTLTERLHLVNYVLTYTSIALMAFDIVRGGRKWIYIFPFVICFLEYAVLIFSTYHNHGLLGTTIKTSVKKILLWLVVAKALNDTDKRDSLLHATRDICLALFAVNFLTEIIYSNGIPSITVYGDSKYYFLGNVNTTIRKVYPGICCSVLIGLKRNKKITWGTAFFALGLIYQFLFRYHGATTIVAVTLLTLWIAFSERIAKHIRTVYPVILGVLVYVEITIVFLPSKTDLILFISKLFGKTITFSGRTSIWDKALTQIANSPIFGYGIQESQKLNEMIGNRFSAHNYFLDLLFQRGMIGLVLYLILIIMPVFLLKRTKTISQYTYVLIGFSCTIFAMSLFEPLYISEAIIYPIILSMIIMLKKEKKMSFIDVIYSKTDK